MPPLTRARARVAGIVPSTVFQNLFLNTDDIVMYMLRFLCLLDFVAFSQTSCRFNGMRKAILRGRISRYVTPFFKPIGYDLPAIVERPEFHTFFNMLLYTRSWIVGSISLAVAIVRSDPAVPNNLNIITSHLYRREWVDFFDDLGFSLIHTRGARGAYAHEGGRILRFVHPDRQNKYITLTTSSATRIFKLFFSAPNTSQQVALGAHHLITPFPVMTSNQEAVQGWCPSMGNRPGIYTFVDHGTYFSESAFPEHVVLHPSTESWSGPCGEACPAVWRDTLGRKQIAQWSWGGVDGADQHPDLNFSGLGREDLQFRLGIGCLNTHCVFSPNYLPPGGTLGQEVGSESGESSDSDTE